MFISIFLPVYLSMFFVVVFKILVISDSTVKDIVGNLVVKIHNQLDKYLVNGKAYLLKGKDVEPGFSPKVAPGKINVKLMTY